MHPDEFEAMERYLEAVLETVAKFDGRASDRGLGEARHLIEHGEPAEGLLTLAWVLHDERIQPTIEETSQLLALTDGLIDPGHLPPGIDGKS